MAHLHAAAGRVGRAAAVLSAVLAITVFLPMTTAHAGMEVVFKATTKGAVVDGYSTFSDQCSYQNTWLSADQSSVYYSSYSYDTCTGMFDYVNGWTTPTSLDITRAGQEAHLVANIPLTDAWGQLVGELHVDNTWVATGKAVRYSTKQTSTMPGEFRYSYTATGKSRPASVSGTVDLQGGNIGTSWMSTMQLSREP